MSLVKKTKNEAGHTVYRARRAGEKSDTKPAGTPSKRVSNPAIKGAEVEPKSGS